MSFSGDLGEGAVYSTLMRKTHGHRERRRQLRRVSK